MEVTNVKIQSCPKISIITPVYNAEKYLHRCVDSIVAQSFQDWELLLIDDGSPDSSGKICDEYANKDFRIKVFHKENGGVASARQIGMMHAIGEYLIHVDPDDWIDVDMLEYLYQEARTTNADITVCDYNIVGHNDEIKKVNVNLPKDNIICLKKILSGEVHSSLCNKLVKRSLFLDNGISFIPGLNMREDLSVMYKLMYYAKKLTYLPKAYYYYVQTGTGYTSQKMSLSHQKNAIQLIDDMDIFFSNHNVSNIVLQGFRYLKAGILCSIALYGNLQYYWKTITYFRDVSLNDIKTKPSTSFILKTAGVLLYSKIIFLLQIMRIVVSIKRKINYDI